MTKPWNRLLWAVEMCPGGKQTIGILGTAWHQVTPPKYPGEPMRALLFERRADARAWVTQPRYHGMNSDWRFRVVRVRETIKIVGAAR